MTIPDLVKSCMQGLSNSESINLKLFLSVFVTLAFFQTLHMQNHHGQLLFRPSHASIAANLKPGYDVFNFGLKLICLQDGYVDSVNVLSCHASLTKCSLRCNRRRISNNIFGHYCFKIFNVLTNILDIRKI